MRKMSRFRKIAGILASLFFVYASDTASAAFSGGAKIREELRRKAIQLRRARKRIAAERMRLEAGRLAAERRRLLREADTGLKQENPRSRATGGKRPEDASGSQAVFREVQKERERLVIERLWLAEEEFLREERLREEKERGPPSGKPRK